MAYPTLSDKLRGGFKAVTRELDLPQTNQVLIAVEKGLFEQRLIEDFAIDGYGPIPKLYLHFNNITDEFPFTHTSVTVAQPGGALHSNYYRVVGGQEDLDRIRGSLVNNYGDQESRKTVGEIFDAARDRVHSTNPIKRFLNGFKNPGPEILK